MKTVILDGGKAESLAQLLLVIRDGGLAAFPTDTVYGVGGLAFDRRAIEHIFAVKERERGKSIPVLLGDMAHLERLSLEPGIMALRLAQRFWPGALTLIMRKHPALPPGLSSFPTIGLRMPDHPLALKLLREAGPLAVSSANLSGGKDCRTAREVNSQLKGRIPCILDGGQTPGGKPSTVVDCTGAQPVILRMGPVSLAEIQAALA